MKKATSPSRRSRQTACGQPRKNNLEKMGLPHGALSECDDVCVAERLPSMRSGNMKSGISSRCTAAAGIVRRHASPRGPTVDRVHRPVLPLHLRPQAHHDHASPSRHKSSRYKRVARRARWEPTVYGPSGNPGVPRHGKLRAKTRQDYRIYSCGMSGYVDCRTSHVCFDGHG